MRLDDLTLEEFINRRLDAIYNDSYELSDYLDGVVSPTSKTIRQIIQEYLDKQTRNENKTV